jgi:hypothetical protein
MLSFKQFEAIDEGFSLVLEDKMTQDGNGNVTHIMDREGHKIHMMYQNHGDASYGVHYMVDDGYDRANLGHTGVKLLKHVASSINHFRGTYNPKSLFFRPHEPAQKSVYQHFANRLAKQSGGLAKHQPSYSEVHFER